MPSTRSPPSSRPGTSSGVEWRQTEGEAAAQKESRKKKQLQNLNYQRRLNGSGPLLELPRVLPDLKKETADVGGENTDVHRNKSDVLVEISAVGWWRPSVSWDRSSRVLDKMISAPHSGRAVRS